MSSDLDNWTTTTTEPRVEFGPGPHQNMPLEWASAGLTWLYANRPGVFADMMTEGVLHIEKKPGRR